MFKRFYITSFFLLTVIIINAQNVYFSQFGSSPLFYNPAATGLFDGEFRGVVNYKNQFKSVLGTVPYVSKAIALDANVLNDRKIFHEDLGIGLILVNDHSGDGALNVLKPILSVAYHKSIDKHAQWNLGAGIHGGMVSKTLDLSKLTFPNQFNGEYYDNTMSTGETNLNSSLLYFDAGMGIVGYYSQAGMNRTMAKATDLRVVEPEYLFGISIDQLNRGNETFLGDKNNIKPRYAFQGLAKFQPRDNINIYTKALYIHNRTSQELAIGGDIEYFKVTPEAKKAVFGGVRVRVINSVVFLVGAEYMNWRVGVNYDLNISLLRIASNGRGGLELSVRYISNSRTGSLNCPKFSPF